MAGTAIYSPFYKLIFAFFQSFLAVVSFRSVSFRWFRFGSVAVSLSFADWGCSACRPEIVCVEGDTLTSLARYIPNMVGYFRTFRHKTTKVKVRFLVHTEENFGEYVKFGFVKGWSLSNLS